MSETYAELVKDKTAPLIELSKALDEIYRLRRALAYEAAVTDAHLSLKSFPKSRRHIAEGSVRRMREAARGEAERAYSYVSEDVARGCLRDAQASETLTRSQFADERGLTTR